MPSNKNVVRELKLIHNAFSSIEGAIGRLALTAGHSNGGANGSAGKTAAGNGKPKLRLSAARRATLKLQGAYMGYMRQLKPREKAKVKAVKLAKGFVPAIKMARELAAA